MKINSAKIANLAGVSRSTVSRVLNNHPNVSEDSRRKILDIIKKYDYVPNINAQALVGKVNKVIGLFIHEPFQNIVYNDRFDTEYFLNFIDTVIREAFSKEYQVLVDYIRNEDDEKRAESFFKNGNISSGIFIGFPINNTFIDKITQIDFKTVIVDYSNHVEKNSNKTLFINTDDFSAAYEVTKKIIEKNCTKTLFFTGDNLKLSGRERKKAFLQCLVDHNITINNKLILDSDYSKEKAYENMKKILVENIEFDSIFSASDNMLFGILKALKEKNIDYHNFEIWGFDNLKYTVPLQLKTVSPMLQNTAKESIKFLISDEVESKVLYTKPKLVQNLNEYLEY